MMMSTNEMFQEVCDSWRTRTEIKEEKRREDDKRCRRRERGWHKETQINSLEKKLKIFCDTQETAAKRRLSSWCFSLSVFLSVTRLFKCLLHSSSQCITREIRADVRTESKEGIKVTNKPKEWQKITQKNARHQAMTSGTYIQRIKSDRRREMCLLRNYRDLWYKIKKKDELTEGTNTTGILINMTIPSSWLCLFFFFPDWFLIFDLQALFFLRYLSLVLMFVLLLIRFAKKKGLRETTKSTDHRHLSLSNQLSGVPETRISFRLQNCREGYK